MYTFEDESGAACYLYGSTAQTVALDGEELGIADPMCCDVDLEAPATYTAA